MKTPRGSRDAAGDAREDAAPAADEDPKVRAMRAVWMSMREEDPPQRGLAELLAAAREKAAAMEPQPSLWQRMIAGLRRAPVLALATVLVLLGGAVFFTRRSERMQPEMVTAPPPAATTLSPARSVDTGGGPSEQATDNQPAGTEEGKLDVPDGRGGGRSHVAPADDDAHAASGASPDRSANNAGTPPRAPAKAPSSPRPAKAAPPPPRAAALEPPPRESLRPGPALRSEVSEPDGAALSPVAPAALQAGETPPAARDDSTDAPGQAGSTGAAGTRARATATSPDTAGKSPRVSAEVEALHARSEAAARRGDCAQVRRLVQRILELDGGYRRRMGKESAVARCLEN